MLESRPPEDYRMIDMGDGTYGVARGDKLIHKGQPTETAALRLAAKEHITERVAYVTHGAVEHAVKLLFDDWLRNSTNLLPAGFTRQKLADAIQAALAGWNDLGEIEVKLEALHEAQTVGGPGVEPPGLGEA